MKLKKSKKGSGLILVIMMFAFLSIVGMAFISMSLSSYKLRIAKSNAKTGLYGAESGIDEAYGIIGNKVDESIKMGNDEVNTFMDKLSEDLINAKKKIYEREKNDDYNSLNENDVKSIIDEIEKGKNYRYLGDIKDCIQVERYTLKKDNQEKQKEKLYVKLYLNDSKVLESQNNIFKDAYTENILEKKKDKKYGDDEIVPILKEISNCRFEINKNKPNINAEIAIGNGEYTNLIKDIDDKYLKKNKKIPIRISSRFKYKGATKQIKADYIINIPPYNKSYYVKDDTQIVHKNPVFTKAISIDGDMIINGKVDIDGDIFVKGNESSNKSDNDKKSNSDNGIIINHKSEFKGKVVTAKNFKIKGVNAECNVKGNIFANNVLLDENAKKSKLTVNKKEDNTQGNVYTQDDLEIDALDSETTIYGAYYGLNNGNNSTEAGSSSSININAVNGGSVNCKLDVKGQGSIIMGTSYAEFYKDEDKNKEHPYQTGESVSIKGNYRAYSFPSDKFKDFTFDYYLPKSDGEDENNNVIVGLVSKDGSSKELNVFDKSKYFKDIVTNPEYNSIFNWDGINLNGADCIHIGSIFKKDNDNVEVSASEENFLIDHLEEVSRRIKEFNTQVYNMGEKIDDIELLSSSKKSVDTQLDKIDNITEIYGKDGENAVIVIKGKEKSLGEKETIEVSDKKLKFEDRPEIKLYTEVEKESKNILDIKNALIIVDGNLKVKGNLNFTGSLIVTGNVEIESGGSLDIKYDENVVRSLISQNYGKLKNVFKNNSEEIFDTLNKTQFDMDGHADIVLNKLIQMKNWKIIK